MRYERRLDFRAFDVLADAIEHGSPEELARAHKSCKEIANDFAFNASKRAIFADFAKLVKKHSK
jgi:hypothetical protein